MDALACLILVRLLGLDGLGESSVRDNRKNFLRVVKDLKVEVPCCCVDPSPAQSDRGGAGAVGVEGDCTRFVPDRHRSPVSVDAGVLP